MAGLQSFLIVILCTWVWMTTIFRPGFGNRHQGSGVTHQAGSIENDDPARAPCAVGRFETNLHPATCNVSDS